MHKSTPVRHVSHHPDIRWIVVVTAVITTGLVLSLYTVWNLTKPSPALVLQNQQQANYISELGGAVKQLDIINQAMQEEIKKQNQVIAELRLELATAQAPVSSTLPIAPKNKE